MCGHKRLGSCIRMWHCALGWCGWCGDMGFKLDFTCNYICQGKRCFLFSLRSVWKRLLRAYLGTLWNLKNSWIVQAQFCGRRIFWLELDGNSFRIKLGLSMRKKVVYCDSGYLKIKSCIQSGWIDSGCKRENVRGAFGLKKRRNLQFCYRSPGCFLDSF